MEITQEYNVDCASQRMVIVMGEIGICLKGEVGQFSSLLLGSVQLIAAFPEPLSLSYLENTFTTKAECHVANLPSLISGCSPWFCVILP
jgi:hypothetical protein